MAKRLDPAGSQPRRELKRFIKVPFRLHREHPQWVAPLIFERMEFLNRRKNAYFEPRRGRVLHRRTRRRAGGPDQRPGRPALGRVPGWQRLGCSASLRRAGSRGAKALLDAAAAWSGARARKRMLGPMDFTTNDESRDPDRGLRAAADDPRALAPALLPRADRGRGLCEGDGPADVGAAVSAS